MHNLSCTEPGFGSVFGDVEGSSSVEDNPCHGNNLLLLSSV